MSHPVVHFEIGGADVAKLTEFYKTLFGWRINSFDPTYNLVEAEGDGGIGGGIMKNPDGVPPYVTIYVQVEELQQSLDKVGELGGSTLVPPTPIPGVGHFAVFQDIEGNAIGLMSGMSEGS